MTKMENLVFGSDLWQRGLTEFVLKKQFLALLRQEDILIQYCLTEYLKFLLFSPLEITFFVAVEEFFFASHFSFCFIDGVAADPASEDISLKSVV